MPRRPSVIRPTSLHISLPEDVRVKLDLLLYSPIEQRIPRSAYQEFFAERIREFLGWRRLTLEPYGYPQGYFIAGPPRNDLSN